MIVPSPTILNGDCLTELPKLAPDSVDLIVTSPPYADARRKQYGGVHPTDTSSGSYPSVTNRSAFSNPPAPSYSI
jgi:DNA modification methylase